jgi:hypothetical protein
MNPPILQYYSMHLRLMRIRPYESTAPNRNTSAIRIAVETQKRLLMLLFWITECQKRWYGSCTRDTKIKSKTENNFRFSICKGDSRRFFKDEKLCIAAIWPAFLPHNQRYHYSSSDNINAARRLYIHMHRGTVILKIE